jgi:hypothetical protein
MVLDSVLDRRRKITVSDDVVVALAGVARGLKQQQNGTGGLLDTATDGTATRALTEDGNIQE